MTVKKKWLVAASAAALVGSVAITKATAKENMGKCIGVNACKGQSACQTAESVCAGQNSCKGKGWIKAEKADCESKGGELKPLKS